MNAGRRIRRGFFGIVILGAGVSFTALGTASRVDHPKSIESTISGRTGMAPAPADDLAFGFATPPRWAKPRVYWWWLYNRVDKAAITRDLEEFHAKGIGGVNLICTGGYAGREPLSGVTWLSPEWRELFRHAVREATRLDIEMGFNLAGGWVMIGPWVTPDDAMKKWTQTEARFRGPGRFSAALPMPATVDGYYRDAFVQAFPEKAGARGAGRPLDPRAIMDLTSRLAPGGRLEWDAPPGEWTILRTGYTLTGSRWDAYPKGDTFPEGAGYQIDCLSTEALDHHFEHLGRIVLDEAASAGGRLAYLWSDSWESGKLTWTKNFPAQFRRFRGYDLAPWLPTLSGRVVLNADATARFKADFDRTIQDGVAENFYARFADLCHRNGVRMGNEAAGPGDIPPMDALRNLGRCDIPTGEFWVNNYRFADGHSLNLKQTASAAHVYGKRQAMAESFTQMDPQVTHWYYGPGELKPYGDSAMAEGINAIMLHCAVCQPPSDGKPGYEFCAGQHWAPNITWWEQTPAFFDYLARCQFMLQQGLFAADAAVFLGEEPPVIAPPKADDPELGPYECDFINADALLSRAAVRDGRIVLPDGMSYRVLVLRNCASTSPETTRRMGEILSLAIPSTPSKSMSLEVARKVRDLVREGATVVGARPETAAGLRGYPGCDAALKAIAAEVWGDLDGVARTERRFGKGRVVWGRTAAEVLAGDGVAPDFAVLAGDALPGEVEHVHRVLDRADVYFVVNRTAFARSAWCAFRVAGKRPEIWDPVAGRMEDAKAFAQSGGRTEVPLELAPRQSLFVVFREPVAADAAGTGRRNSPRFEREAEIRGRWTVRFDPAWGGPRMADFPWLVSWTDRPEDGIRHYSGLATYEIRFDDPEAGFAASGKPLFAGRRWLDLGSAKDVAVVRLNGTPLGVLWTDPWRVEVTGLVRPQGNALEVDVVNLWSNRVIRDLQLPKERRVTVTHDAFRFDELTAKTPLRASGLFGPVGILREIADAK